MRSCPENWAALFTAPHTTEYKFLINGVAYLSHDIQNTPVIEKPLMQEPCIGRCCSGSLSITIRQHIGESIPKAASVIAYCRLSSRDGQTQTEWVEQGCYWISRRVASDGLVTLTCRDGMMLLGQTYLDKTRFTQWPVPMAVVLNEILSITGLQADSRTQIKAGPSFVVDYPNDDVLMSEILSMIAAAHGGNFVMTEVGKLRLIPYPDTVVPLTSIGTAYSKCKLLSNGAKTVSRITLTDSAENQFTCGDDSGIELAAACEYATQETVNQLSRGYSMSFGELHVPVGSIANGQLYLADNSAYNNGSVRLSADTITGRSFLPYELYGAYIDPLIELGDTFSLVRKGETLSLIAGNIKIKCNSSFVCDIQDGVQDDDEDEVPFISAVDLKAKRYISTRGIYHGNRINRTEGFVSELMENGEPIARMIANSNRFSMQRKHGSEWEDCLYFDPVAKNYKFSGEVEIEALEEVSAVSLTNTSLVFSADADGKTFARTYDSNVFAYTGKSKVLPVVSEVTGAAQGMSVTVGAPVDRFVPITVSVSEGENLGSDQSTNGTLVVHVTSPVEISLEINWCKVNTGVSGETGEDGVTFYSWIKYADTPTSGMSDSPSGKKYIGLAYNKSSPEKSIEYGDYAWSLIKGTDGANGYSNAVVQLYQRANTNYLQNDGVLLLAGSQLSCGTVSVSDGVSTLLDDTVFLPGLSAPNEELTYTFSSNTLSGNIGAWSREIPKGGLACYTMMAAISSANDVTSVPTSAWCSPVLLVENGAPGRDGADGQDAVTQYTWIKYADTPTSGMSDNPVGKKYMGLAYNKDVQTESTDYADYSWSLIKGEDGTDGINGVDGTTYYTWVKYADDASGANMSDDPTDKFFIGIAYNKSSPDESTVASDYAWSLYRGSDGVDGRDGAPGSDGQDGEDGINTAFVCLYIRAESTPPTPTNTLLYTFATASLSGNLEGWSQNIPTTNGNPCWVTSARVVARTATASVLMNAWSAQSKLAEDGEGGASTYCQPEEPQNGRAEDLWIDSDDNYKLYRHDGMAWVSVQDTNIPDIILQLAAAQTSLNVLSQSIEGSVTETWVSNQLDALLETFNSAMALTAQALELSFTATAQNAAGSVDNKYGTLIRASGDGVEIGKTGSNFKVLLTNERMSFLQVSSGTSIEVAYMSNQKLFITDAQITHELSFGNDGGNRFVWTKTNKGLSLRYISA